LGNETKFTIHKAQNLCFIVKREFGHLANNGFLEMQDQDN